MNSSPGKMGPHLANRLQAKMTGIPQGGACVRPAGEGLAAGAGAHFCGMSAMQIWWQVLFSEVR